MSLPNQPALPPIIIPGQRATEIIEQVVYERLSRIKPGLDMAYPDGMFPGQKKLPAKQRLSRYLSATDPADYTYLQDKDYIKKFRAGVLPPLKSPMWLNLSAIPELFDELARAFSRLAVNAMDEEEPVG